LRTHKSGDVFYIIFYSGTGKTSSDFTVRYYKNNVLQTPLLSGIAEVGSAAGTYTLSFPLTGVGDWHVDIHSGGIKDFDVDIKVTDKTIDDLFTLMSGQVGLKTVTLTVNDGSTNVPGVVLNVYDSTNSVFLATQTTDASGQAVVVLDQGTYKLRLYKSGVATTTADLTVGAAATQSATVTVASTSISAPSSASVCRLFADFVKIGGAAYANVVVTVENMYLATSSMSVVERETSHKSNSAGRVEFDAVRGMKLRISFETTTFVREITVPDAATANLLTLMGAATDPFVVVT
tara:strand:- start:1025 stop:1900 length:876 start_codon:yes stop_codon:yes gene_type:complete